MIYFNVNLVSLGRFTPKNLAKVQNFFRFINTLAKKHALLCTIIRKNARALAYMKKKL